MSLYAIILASHQNNAPTEMHCKKCLLDATTEVVEVI